MLIIRPAHETDYEQIVALFNAQTGSNMSADRYAADARNRPADMDAVRVVAHLPDGRFAGYGFAGVDDEVERNFTVTVRVDEACRGLGAGTGLLRALANWARARGAARLEATLNQRQAEQLGWAARRGFVTEGLVTRSELKLAGWQPDSFISAVTAAEEGGIRFTTLAEAGATEENLRRFHGLCKDLEHDVPGRAPKFPPYEAWRAHIETDPSWDPACVLLAVDGAEWVALSFFEKQSDGSWYTRITGVHPAHRGRGLGTAIKVAAVRLAHASDVPYISTYNHNVNAAMVAINRQLGYEAVHTLVQIHLPL
ncbi:MAG: hypothetical protein K0R39_3911 [Symbiobacteriaceae bacterium]|jgi:GNAT superfamily N-acetyltransferase|nr:hypothetical protein [Symbiobacteriaceae bacterium]